MGAAAANEVRAKKAAKKADSATSAAAIIKGANNAAVAGDGTAAQGNAPLAPFPSDKYKTDVPMPDRAKSLVGKKLLYVFDDGKGDGLKWRAFNVKGAKGGSRIGADGEPLHTDYKFELVLGKKGDAISCKLPGNQYGIEKKWFAAVKK